MPRRKRGDMLLTLNQAAALPGVNVKPSTIRAAIKRKILSGEKRGRDWFVYQSDLMHWLEYANHKSGRPRKT